MFQKRLRDAVITKLNLSQNTIEIKPPQDVVSLLYPRLDIMIRPQD
jgi:hypothetical protein